MSATPHPRRLTALSPIRVLVGNPVLLHELRGRMRGMRAFAVLTVYLVVMAGLAVALYALYLSTFATDINSIQGGVLGKTLFTVVTLVEVLLIAFIVPGFTVDALTGERERQTYDLLRTTMLRPRTLVIGKLLSALAYVFLLLLATVPLQGIAFLFGGVDAVDLGITFVVLLVTAIAVGAVGIACSAWQQKTRTASAITYGVTIVMLFGLPLATLGVVSLLGPLVFDPNGVSTSLQVGTGLLYVIGLLVSLNPFTAVYVSQSLLTDHGAGFFTQTLSNASGSTTVPLIAPWIVFALWYLLLSTLLIAVAVRRVNRLESTEER
jgi:ABC-2 type transport system permease protein